MGGDGVVPGVLAGGDGVDPGGLGVDAATVSISTFIPCPQCPSFPQMKYRLPTFDSGNASFPVVPVAIGLLAPQLS